MAVVEQGTSTKTTTNPPPGFVSVLRAKATHVAWDLAVAFGAILAVSSVHTAGADGGIAAFVLLAGWAFWLGRARLYSARFITRRADEIRRIIDAGALAAATAGVAAFAFELSVDRTWLATSAVCSAAALGVEREIFRRRYENLRRSGQRRRRVLMIGDNDETRLLAKMFDEEQELGYDVVDQIDPSRIGNPNDLTTQVLAAARAENASGAVIAASAIETGASNRLIRDLVDAGIHVELSSTLADINPDRLTVRPLGRFPVVYVEPVLRNGWRAVAKRAFDVTAATAAIVMLSPIMAIIALRIKTGSDGPVLFRQSRVGKDAVPFDVLKFRTMVTNAEEILADLMEDNEGAGPLFKMKDDPRVTKVGRFLRKTSLDELPQLFNVVKGQMSLVGPRPALASEMAAWESDLYGRLRVKPGITGMWQVSGRSETSFEEYTRLDLYYVDNWSLVVDLSILARTVPAVLKSDGAY